MQSANEELMAAKKDKTVDIKARIVQCALDLAVEQGWEYTTLRDIAQRAELTPAELFSVVDDKSDVLILLGRQIDQVVYENVSLSEGGSLSVRDALFDILMERFDVLNEYREGLVSILDSFKFDPKELVISLPHLCKSMSRTLEMSGASSSGVKGALKVVGLTGIYLKVLRVWCEDDTQDLSKTMAALDKALERAENWADTLGF